MARRGRGGAGARLISAGSGGSAPLVTASPVGGGAQAHVQMTQAPSAAALLQQRRQQAFEAAMYDVKHNNQVADAYQQNKIEGDRIRAKRVYDEGVRQDDWTKKFEMEDIKAKREADAKALAHQRSIELQGIKDKQAMARKQAEIDATNKKNKAEQEEKDRLQEQWNERHGLPVGWRGTNDEMTRIANDLARGKKRLGYSLDDQRQIEEMEASYQEGVRSGKHTPEELAEWRALIDGTKNHSFRRVLEDNPDYPTDKQFIEDARKNGGYRDPNGVWHSVKEMTGEEAAQNDMNKWVLNEYNNRRKEFIKAHEAWRTTLGEGNKPIGEEPTMDDNAVIKELKKAYYKVYSQLQPTPTPTPTGTASPLPLTTYGNGNISLDYAPYASLYPRFNKGNNPPATSPTDSHWADKHTL